MTDLLRLIVDIIGYIWPNDIIKPWERAGLYICGLFVCVVGPGLYPKIPWFVEFHAVSVVPAPISTPRLDFHLKDRSLVSVQPTGVFWVEDVALALNSIDDYMETTQEFLGMIVADKGASVDADRWAPEKRARLLSDMTRWLDDRTRQFGVRCSELFFTTLVFQVKPYRLLQDITPKGW